MTEPLIIVFGRTGQVAEALAAADPTVKRLSSENCDLRSVDAEEVIATIRPAAVINAAAYTAVDKAESDTRAAVALNRDAPAAMARGCAALGIPFVHISTDYVFDGAKAGPYVETDPVAPLGVYGRSKAEGEAAIMAVGGAWTIFRTAWVVSPRGANFVNTMRQLGGERDQMRVVDDQHGRLTLATDIAALCLEAARRGIAGDRSLQGLFHLAGADDATWADIAEHVFADLERRTGRRPTLERITTADYPTPARRPANSRLDTAKLQQAAAWSPRPWRDAVDLCLAEQVA